MEKECQEEAKSSYEVGDFFQNIIGELKKIWVEFLGQQDLIQAVCTKVEVDDLEQFLLMLDKLLHQKMVADLQTKVDFLLKKSAWLEYKLNEEKDFQYAVNNMNESLDVIQKIEDYIGHLGNVVNKAKLFDSNLETNPVSRAKVISMLVDFGQKMEEILDNMKNLFEGFKAVQSTPLELVPNISMDTKGIPSLKAWGAEAAKTTRTPTKSD